MSGSSPGGDVQRWVSYQEFVETDLRRFSLADVVRSVPSVVDGLKPSQRKVLFACFKRRLTGEPANHTFSPIRPLASRLLTDSRAEWLGPLA